MDVEFMQSRAKRYHYLSTLFRDEIPLELIAAMQKDEFLDGFNESVKGCGFIDLISGAEVMTSFLKSGAAGLVCWCVVLWMANRMNCW